MQSPGPAQVSPTPVRAGFDTLPPRSPPPAGRLPPCPKKSETPPMRHLFVRACAALLLLPVGGALAQSAETTRRPITHEDVWLMQRPGALAASPDGRWFVASVASPAYEDDQKSSDLWIMASDGSTPPRRLTAGKGSEGDPAWSPDSHAHRLLRQARGGRRRADLRARPRRRRGAARHELAGRRAGSALQPGRPLDPVRGAHLPRRRRPRRTTARPPPIARRASTTSAPTTASRSATGTAGSTNCAPRSWCSRSTARPRRATCSPAPRCAASAATAAGSATRAIRSRPRGRPTAAAWCSRRPPTATRRRAPR